MAELGDMLTYASNGDEEGIHVEMLDYGYIETCTDPKTLRGIVQVLKSGKEGLYPELMKAAEDKLISVLPAKERNRILKLRQQVSPDEVHSAENEVDNWIKQISSVDSKLKKEAGSAAISRLQERPVRGQTSGKTLPTTSKGSGVKASSSSTGKTAAQRLSGYDFRAWEKFDVDKAIAEMDGEEVSTSAAANETIAKNKATAAQLADDITVKRKQLFQREMADLLDKMEAGGLSQVQMEIMAGREKTKGNECFRCGEHEAAFEHYSRSIALDPTVSAYFTNRALVGIKLNRFETAEDDCTRALQLDAKALKPWWLRGSARLHRGRCSEAIRDYESALRLDPDNGSIQDMLAKAMDKFEEAEGRPYAGDLEMMEATEASVPSDCLFSTCDIRSVFTWSEMHVPTSYVEVSSGVLRVCEENDAPHAAAQQSFTRIAIVDDSDEEDEQDEEVGDPSSPTRIAISCVDSSDDDEVEKEVTNAPPSGFTRINIADSDSSDGEEEGSAMAPFALESIEQLKAQGNAQMQTGDLKAAIDSYSTALAMVKAAGDSLAESSSNLTIALLNNRGFAHLSNNSYASAIADTTSVLTLEPVNVKALYRRALALEGSGDLKAAESDATLLLSIDQTHKLAIELAQRVSSKIHPAPTKAQPAPTQRPPQPIGGEEEIKLEKVKHAAMKHLAEGDYEAAIKKLEAAVGESKDPTTLPLQQLLMTAHRGLGQDRQVIAAADRILAADKDNFRAVLCRGGAHLNLGSLENAKLDALAALRVDASNSEGMSLLDAIQQAEELSAIKLNQESVADKSNIPKAASSLSAEEESIRLKDAGNEALGKEKFDMAIALYTEALKVNENNMAALNNRAMAFLKINRFIDAERDATTLLDKEKAEGKIPNVKALYRRGLARKNIGGKGSLLGAQDDFTTLLKIEPANKTAKNEKAKVEQLLSDMHYSKSSSAPVLPVSAATGSASDNSFGLTARSTVMKRKVEDTATPEPAQPAPAVAVTVTKQAQPSMEQPSTSSPAKHLVQSTASAVSTPPPAKVSTVKAATPGSSGRKMKEPVVPTEPPRTLYELERVWRGLKFRSDLFGRYVQTFTKSTFKHVFKEAMTPDLLSSILSTMRTEIVPVSPETALRLLNDMTNIASFSMTMALLPAEDVAILKDILDALRVHLGTDSAAVSKLFGAYGVKLE